MTTPNNTVAGRPFDLNPRENPERARFEEWYTTHAFDYAANPIGSRDCDLQWRAWKAALASPAPSATVGVEVKANALADELKLASEQEDDLSASIAYADASGRVRTLAAALQHPAAPSASPAYDRELIARMLEEVIGGPYSRAAVEEQIHRLRDADNADAASIRTVNRSPSAAGDAGELPGLPTPAHPTHSLGPLYSAAQMRWYGERCRRLATAEQPVISSGGIVEVSPEGAAKLLRDNGTLVRARKHMKFEQPGSAVQGECSHSSQTSDGIFTECDHCGATISPPAPAAEQAHIAEGVFAEHPDSTDRATFLYFNGSGDIPVGEEVMICRKGSQPEARGVEGMVHGSIAHQLYCEIACNGDPACFNTLDLATQRRWVEGVEKVLAAAPSGVRVDDAMVERAMRARIPGGSEAWVWLFNCEGGMAPEGKHRDWFHRILTAALSANEVSRG